MTRIVWIASYPRSGNTWLRFLVANLLLGNIESSAQLAMTVPDIHRFVTGRHLMGPERSFIKTHWAWQPEFPLRENTESVIYLLRHPLDVVESALNYAARGAGAFVRDAADAELDRFARNFVGEFVNFGGSASWYRQGFGSWLDNVASWTGKPLPFPRLVVRYEALRRDPAGELAAIARFAGLPSDADRVAAAVERSSMERLGNMEQQELDSEVPGFFFSRRFAKSAEAGFKFIGGDDRRRLTLTEDERARLTARFAPAMAQLGYE